MLVLSSARGEGMAATSGYARMVRLWRRGTHVDQAAVIFQTKAAHVSVGCTVDGATEPPRMWLLDATESANCEVWLGDRTGAETSLDLPSNMWMRSHHHWLALKPRESWSVAGRTYTADSVIVIPLPVFLAGSRQFEVLFEPGPRHALQSFFWSTGKLVLCILDELRPVFDICAASGNGWNREQLGALPDLRVEVWSLDRYPPESNGDLLVHVEDPLTPPSLILMERGIASPAVLKQAPRAFAAEHCVVTQHEVTSSDGERIPYRQTGPRQRDRQRAGPYERIWRVWVLRETVPQFRARQALARLRRHHGSVKFARPQ
ncbi:prolyl oligopeptidase PreP (S9A serine peptidase family) [Bradyrhizobium sp. JR4.1]